MNQAEIITRLQVVFDKLFLEPPQLTPQLTAAEVPEWDSLLQISLLVAVGLAKYQRKSESSRAVRRSLKAEAQGSAAAAG